MERERALHGASHSMQLFSFPTEFIQSSYPDDEQSGSDLFLTPHPLSSSLSDRQESNATDRLTGPSSVKVLGGEEERSWVGADSSLFREGDLQSRALFLLESSGIFLAEAG